MLALRVNAWFNTALAQREEKKQTASHLAGARATQIKERIFSEIVPLLLGVTARGRNARRSAT